MGGDLDRLPELLAELRERIPEGNGVVKDLRAAIRDAIRAEAALPKAVEERIAKPPERRRHALPQCRLRSGGRLIRRRACRSRLRPGPEVSVRVPGN